MDPAANTDNIAAEALTFLAAPSITGPCEAVDRATSPYTFTPEGNALFGRIRSGAN